MGIIFNQTIVQLLVLTASAPEKTGLIVKAPETLDLSQLQNWISGSVWALLSLNLIALGIFVVNALYPQIIRALTGSKAFLAKFLPAKKLAKTVEAAETAEKIEVMSGVEEVFEKPITPASTQVAPSPTPPAPEPFSESVTEEIDLPKIPDQPAPVETAAAEPPPYVEPPHTEILSNPVPPADAGYVTEILSNPMPPAEPVKSPPLPDSSVSAETEVESMHSESLKSLDETLSAVLADTQDATDELSIFDPASIDKVLQEEQKQEDQKK